MACCEREGYTYNDVCQFESDDWHNEDFWGGGRVCGNENPWSSNNTNFCRPQIIWMATCLKYVKIPEAKTSWCPVNLNHHLFSNFSNPLISSTFSPNLWAICQLWNINRRSWSESDEKNEEKGYMDFVWYEHILWLMKFAGYAVDH